jgi:hypothetical protein
MPPICSGICALLQPICKGNAGLAYWESKKSYCTEGNAYDSRRPQFLKCIPFRTGTQCPSSNKKTTPIQTSTWINSSCHSHKPNLKNQFPFQTTKDDERPLPSDAKEQQSSAIANLSTARVPAPARHSQTTELHRAPHRFVRVS